MLSNKLRRAWFACLVAGLLIAWPVFMNGQVTNQNNIGLPENGVFSGSSFDNTQLNNGNLHIETQLFALDGRGLKFQYKYVYDNKGWEEDIHCGHTSEICTGHFEKAPGNNMSWGLASPLAYSIFSETTTFPCATGAGNYFVRTNYILKEPDGTKHSFLPAQLTTPSFANSTCPAYGSTLYASDGSGWIVQTDPTSGMPTKAVGPNGIQVTGSVQNGALVGNAVVDANGNQLTSTTDTLGRTLPSLQFNSSTGKYELKYFDSSGTERVIQITRITVPVQTSLCLYTDADICYEYSGSNSVISEIEFPNGMKYTFTYVQNSHGEPTNVILPTGGQVSWSWASGDSGGRRVATRTVTVTCPHSPHTGSYDIVCC